MESPIIYNFFRFFVLYTISSISQSFDFCPEKFFQLFHESPIFLFPFKNKYVILYKRGLAVLFHTKGAIPMKYNYTCKKVSLNDSIKDYAEKKISKLDRYFRDDATANVTFSVEKEHLCTVEITIRGGGGPLLRTQTEAPDGDMRGAIDTAVGYIERQILKNKTRLAKRLRSESFPPPAPTSDFEVQEEQEFPIVRTKRFAVKPMSTEEAILQMNLLDHSFFVFRNSSDDSLCIVYRRKSGGYGLIATDEEE